MKIMIIILKKILIIKKIGKLKKYTDIYERNENNENKKYINIDVKKSDNIYICLKKLFSINIHSFKWLCNCKFSLLLSLHIF